MKRYLLILVFIILFSNAVTTMGLSYSQTDFDQGENTIEISLIFPKQEDLQFQTYKNKQIITHDTFGFHCEPGNIMLPSKNIFFHNLLK